MFKTGEEVIPISLGGASYNDAKLIIKDSILIISPSFKSYLFEIYLQVLTWAAFLFMISIVWGEQSSDANTFIKVVTIFCISVSLIVRFIFSRIRKSHNFDKKLDAYFPRKSPNSKTAIKLSEINKLHLISKEIYSSNKSYTCFELSFCTLDGLRVLIINHGDRYEITKAAQALSDFLGVRCEELKKGQIYQEV